MTKKQAHLLCFLGLFFLGTGILFLTRRSVPFDASIISKQAALEDYDYLWYFLEENYPFLSMAERKYPISVNALKKSGRQQIEAFEGESLDFYNYYQILQDRIGHFHQLAHLSLLSPAAYQTFLLEDKNILQNESNDFIAHNYNILSDSVVYDRYAYLAEKTGNPFPETAARDPSAPIISAPTESSGKSSTNLSFRDINEKTGYIKVNSFKYSFMETDKKLLKEWFLAHTDTDYIIIDITGNGGGSSAYWMNLIVSPNIRQAIDWNSIMLTPYGKESREQFASTGIQKSDLNPNLKDLETLPAINPTDLQDNRYYISAHFSVSPSLEAPLCSGQFFLLVDSQVASAADGFAQFCKATGFATVIGENTWGDGGGTNVYIAKLPKSKLILRYRAMHVLNADGSSNVEFGTTPDILCKRVSGFSGLPALSACLEYIESLEKEN